MKAVRRILSQIMVVALVLAGIASTHAFHNAASASNEMSANCECPPDAGCNPDACSHSGDCAAMCAGHAIDNVQITPAFQTSSAALIVDVMAIYSSVHARPLLPPPTA